MNDTSSTQQDFMARALELAQEAALAGEVPVGAVIVDPKSYTIIAEGANQPILEHDPTAHAEIIAIRKAGERLGNYRLPGMDLYVTLEPCVMCAGAISFARLRRIVFAADDPKGGALVNGVRFFEAPTCHWRPDVSQSAEHAPAAAEMLKQFFADRRKSSSSR